MSNNINRRVWQGRWGYAESIAIVVGIVVIGLALQLAIGSFDFYTLAHPVNYTVGLLIFHFSLLIGYMAPKRAVARYLSSIEFSVSLIGAILFMTIIMGLTPQIAEGEQTAVPFGFDAMTRNWSFVLLYGMTLLSLGGLIVRRILRIKMRDIPFMLLHIGLYFTLFASGFGYADMERYVMYVTEGETQWRVYDSSGEVKELPIAITLNDFDMDVYPPRLVVVDRDSGEVQPLESPEYYQIDQDLASSKIAGWHIEPQEYIHKAVRGADSTYREVPMPGSTPAIKIAAWRDSVKVEGWVCGGNQAQSYMSLPLTEQHSIVMTPAEPREYRSDVEVYTQDGSSKQSIIKVNHPLSIDNWTIYQYGYDNAAGSLSSYSSFELVYDRWLKPVYVGIILMMLGSLSMILRGRNRKSKEDDVE